MSRVLAIDDQRINLEIYERLLRQMQDVEVVTFTSPLDALAYAEHNVADLLLIDYMMPECDGLGVLERVRTYAIQEDVPIVMITAAAERDVRRRALELGANDFLEKPVDPTEFKARVRNLLVLRERGTRLRNRALQLADEVRAATALLRLRELEVIHRLTKAAEYRDQDTGDHIIRLGQYSALLGEGLGLGPDEVELLQLAAPMHDIGKVATPDHILLKPGRLTPDELEIMRRHPVAGYDILKNSESPLLQRAAEIALSHHEWWDGNGYPHGLAGDAVPLSARIVAVADVFDALVSSRPYKRPWSFEEASELIAQKAGTHFDPAVVGVFERLKEKIRAISSAAAAHSMSVA